MGRKKGGFRSVRTRGEIEDDVGFVGSHREGASVLEKHARPGNTGKRRTDDGPFLGSKSEP